MTYFAKVPHSIFYRLDPDDQSPEGEPVEVEFEWTAGRAPTGLSGPPENYDPGEADEFNIVSHDLDEHDEERVLEWLDENWERPPEDDGYDWGRDDDEGGTSFLLDHGDDL